METRAKQFFKWFLKKARNKYFLIAVIFFLWLLIFDSSSFIDIYRVRKQINKLNNEKSYYHTKIENDSRKINELRTNNENLEKFAREQYFMKKPNEDLFIIDESKL